MDLDVLLSTDEQALRFRVDEGPTVDLLNLVGSIRADSRVSLVAPTATALIWSPPLAQAWACDCAERVLPLFERDHPGVPAVREAVLVARSAAPPAERQRAEDACEAAWRACYDGTRAGDAQTGAVKAARAALATLAEDPAVGAPSFAAFAVEREMGSVEAAFAEYRWQGRRLLAYLAGREPPRSA